MGTEVVVYQPDHGWRGRPRTRPRCSDPGIAEAIAERMIAGEPVWKILDDPTMPNNREFYNYRLKNPAFDATIARAYRLCQDAEVDNIIQILDNAAPTSEGINHAKNRVWGRMWVAGRRNAKKYGDKVTVENIDSNTQSTPSKLDDGQIKDFIKEVVSEDLV